MTSGPLLKVCMMCVFALTVLSLGCAHTISSESTRIRQASWQADLDEYKRGPAVHQPSSG